MIMFVMESDRDRLLVDWAKTIHLIERVEKMTGFSPGTEIQLTYNDRQLQVDFEAIGISSDVAGKFFRQVYCEHLKSFAGVRRKEIQERFGCGAAQFNAAHAQVEMLLAGKLL
jgi:hypothetical protein